MTRAHVVLVSGYPAFYMEESMSDFKVLRKVEIHWILEVAAILAVLFGLRAGVAFAVCHQDQKASQNLTTQTGLLLMIYCCVGAITANRRTRLRGVYGIKGSLADDCVKSLFCNRCILMQQDREIRAREGNNKLRTRAGCAEEVNMEPRSNEEMRYVSPRRTDSNISNPFPQQRLPNRLQKHHQPLLPNLPSHREKSITPGRANVSGSPVLLGVPSKKCQ